MKYNNAYFYHASLRVNCLQLRLPAYLILFTTLAFVTWCQFWPTKVPSPLVFLPISSHFTATVGIPFTSTELKLSSFRQF